MQARALPRVVALLLWLLLAQAAWAVDVPLTHPVYPFLTRLEARGLLATPLSGARPWSRAAVAAELEELAAQTARLNPVEWQQWQKLRWEFADTQAARDTSGYVPAWQPLAASRAVRRTGLCRNGRDFWSAENAEWALYVNPLIRISREYHEADDGAAAGTLATWSSGYELRGRVHDFGFAVRGSDTHVSGDIALADSTAYPYRYGPGKTGFDYDATDAALSWQGRYAEVLFGKTRTRWGWAETGGLAFSGDPTSHTQLRLTAHVGPLELTAVQAKLVQRPPVIERVDTLSGGRLQKFYADKYLAAHRVQVNASRRLQIGVYEATVYGQRGFELEYLNPLMFLRSAEHYTGDRDNALLGADFRWRAPGRTVVYGELLIDDITTSRLGTGWYGNKLGYLGGGTVTDPLGLPNTRLCVEYARIEPYVYSHKFAINSFQHYGLPLGYAAGPNSDTWYGALAWTVARPVELRVWARRERHGANPASGRNVGGDMRRPWQPGDAERVSFLDGDLETRQSAGVSAGVDVLLRSAVRGEWGLLEADAKAGRAGECCYFRVDRRVGADVASVVS